MYRPIVDRILYYPMYLGGGGLHLGWGSASGRGWADPLPPWTEWQTGVKSLPCPKLRLRWVTTFIFPNISSYLSGWSNTCRLKINLSEARFTRHERADEILTDTIDQHRRLVFEGIARHWCQLQAWPQHVKCCEKEGQRCCKHDYVRASVCGSVGLLHTCP